MLFLSDVCQYLLDCRHMLLLAPYLVSFMTVTLLSAKYQDTCFGGRKCGPVPGRIRLLLEVICFATHYSSINVWGFRPIINLSMSRISGILKPCQKCWLFCATLLYKPTVLTMKLLACLICISCRFSSHLVLYQTSSIHPFKTVLYHCGGKL